MSRSALLVHFRLIAVGLGIIASFPARAESDVEPCGYRTSIQPADDAVAHDGAGLELHDVSRAAGASNTYQCFDTTGAVAVPVGEPARFQPVVPWPGPTIFAPRPGGFVAFGAVTPDLDPNPYRIDVADFDCQTGFSNFRRVSVPTTQYPNGGRAPGCGTPDATSVVTPDLHIFFITADGVCHWNPSADTFTRELTPDALEPLLTHLAAGALDEAFGEPRPTVHWQATTMVALQDGALWIYVHLIHPSVPNGSRHDFRFIVRRAPDGTLTTVGPMSDGGSTWQPIVTPTLHFDPTSGRVIEWSSTQRATETARYLGVRDVLHPERPQQFCGLGALDMPAPGADDHIPLGPGPRRFRLRIDPDFFDGDRDGLSLAEEGALGTVDARLDSDGDGAADGHEVHVLGTDPTDASEPALTEAQRATRPLAPSTYIDDWQFLLGGSPARPERGGSGVRISDGALCSSVKFANRQACFEADGTSRQPWPLPEAATTNGVFAEGGRCLFFDRDQRAVMRRDQETGEEVEVYTGQALEFWASSCDTLFVRAPDLTVVRLSRERSFVVFDGARTCPLAGSEAELSNCAERRLDRPAGSPPSLNLDIFDIDPDTSALLVALDTWRGKVIASVDGARAVHLANVGALHPVWPLVDLVAEPGGRRFALVGPAGFNHLTDQLAVVPLTAGWAPIHDMDPPMPLWAASPSNRMRPFAGHLVGPRFLPTHVVLDPTPVDGCPPCCACGPGGMACLPCNPEEPPKTATWYLGGLAQWVPVEPALQPGETVFSGVLANVLSTVQNAHSGWGLFRSTIDGAVIRFLDADTMARLGGDAERRELKRLRPASAIALGASPDAKKLCFVDPGLAPPGDQRVWVLELDADRRPARVVLANTGAWHACAFDDDGTLALLGTDGRIEVGGRTLGTPESVAVAPFPLIRAVGRWIAPAGSRVRCLDDDGAVVGTPRDVTGVAPGPRDLVYFTGLDDGISWGGAATVADFCAGARPTDTWFVPTRNIYDVADDEYHLTGYDVTTSFARLAVRPDGVVFAALHGIRTALPGMAGPPAPMFRIRPAWIPADPSGEVRLEELDPERRTAPRVSIHQVEASVEAMVTLPGGDAAKFKAADNWEYQGIGRPEPPTWPKDVDVVDEADPAPADPAPRGGDDGCGTGETPTLWWLTVVLLGVWRRRATTAGVARGTNVNPAADR